jgi:hypothetical protein
MQKKLSYRGLILVSVLILLSYASTAQAAPKNDCDRAASEFDCYGVNNGSVSVSIGRSHPADPHMAAATRGDDAGQDAGPINIERAFCADATADVAAATGAAPEIEALCGFAPLEAAPRVVVPGREQVATAFRELGLYRGSVRTDPGIASLVNLETYFWCGDDRGRTCDAVGEGERTVTLLGQPVRIRPRILRYDWSFGDGAGQRVAAGRAAHTYGRPGIMAVVVTLTWTADYAVGGGGFQPIGDTTTTTSPVRMLPVREAEAVVVAGG